ncbi:hypothetical protein CA850_30220 [Micromonospora echinospora]|uniref:Uncharacterized protein n=1 Tax=Micromonospora echinospora TaxID=1877 RepID=A0A1C4Z5N4_MICEC|nr:hypothetical protein [Micromonospora echinospora]OZV74292.1 hypothetical protein CA850_30220 [Micromonospora echinospora]SCF27881.1 hypothetical protein GA0070618_4765 [Micromonospora echinospora]
MAISGRRARRAALALLSCAALTALVGGTAVAAPVDAPPDRIRSVTDVWMRDVATDVGLQPHWGNPIWASPDVRVCRTPVPCDVSANPVVGATNYIKVQLRNPGPYGSGTDTGILRFYRTDPGGGLVWPTAWTPVTSVTVVVPPGVTTVLVPWIGVPGPGHFELLAVWDSVNDPLPLLGPDIMTNVRYHNNIAWRGVDSVIV